MLFIWVIGFCFSLTLTMDRLSYTKSGAGDVFLLLIAWPLVLGNQVRKKAGWRDDKEQPND